MERSNHQEKARWRDGDWAEAEERVEAGPTGEGSGLELVVGFARTRNRVGAHEL